MPYLKIETNKQLNDIARQELLKKTSNFIATMLGKPEKYVMVSLKLDAPMLFGGGTQPTAYVELKSIGLRRDQCPAYSKAICDYVEAELNIAPDRTYIEFSDIDGTMFGWDRGTF